MNNAFLIGLAQQYGSPLFVIDEPKLVARAQALQAAFQAQWPKTRVCYSVKTNYLPWIVKKMASLGIQPEVISGFELDLVEHLAIDGEILVNGPVKTASELQKCIERNYVIHVDNLDELTLLAKLTAELCKPARIALRLRPESESWKRFGFKVGSAAWQQALGLIEEHAFLTLVGLHLHIGTGIIQLDKYRQAAEFMANVAKSLPHSLEYVDMGGGFATAIARLSHYTAEQWQVPTDTAYAEAILAPLADYLQQHDCSLVIEPGRALIDESIDLICQGVSVDDERIIVDAGKNIVPSVEARVHPIDLLSLETQSELSAKPMQAYDIFGPLCMGSDCLGRQVVLPTPKVGDYLLLSAVGAYSQSQSMQFIKYQAAVVVVNAEQTATLVRRRQQLADLLVVDL